MSPGRPDIFLTFTCNSSWPEIIEASKPDHPADRPDIVARVFQLRVEELMRDIMDRHVLGRIVAFTRVIEFQKRGLPHCHMLLILADECKPRDTETVDKLVQAEIPDPELYPRLYKLVTGCMMHRACHSLPDAACRKDCSDSDVQCKKRFPKPECLESSLDENGYASYRRRRRFTVTLRSEGREFVVSDEYCVSYNSYLLLKYEAHMNLEICSSVKCFKYLYKYVFKGK